MKDVKDYCGLLELMLLSTAVEIARDAQYMSNKPNKGNDPLSLAPPTTISEFPGKPVGRNLQELCNGLHQAFQDSVAAAELQVPPR